MARSISKLAVDEEIVLNFNGTLDRAKFLYLSTDGERAGFRSTDTDGRPYEWQAYRHNGRWVFGSSAERLSIATPDAINRLAVSA